MVGGTSGCRRRPEAALVLPRVSKRQRFRRLKRNEVVWSGDFVADERLGFELWEAPDVFRAGSFARPIYQKEETERFRPTSTRKPKQKITAYLNQTAAGARASAPFLENHNLPYEDRDIINNPFNYAEILEKSGQSLSSCVEVNGHMPGRCQRGRSGSLPARSRRAALTAAVADAPANWACDAHHHYE